MDENVRYESTVATVLYLLEGNDSKDLFYHLEDAQIYAREMNIQGSIIMVPVKRVQKMQHAEVLNEKA